MVEHDRGRQRASSARKKRHAKGAGVRPTGGSAQKPMPRRWDAVVREGDEPGLLETVLNDSGFWELLESSRALLGKEPDAYRVFIKPDLAGFERESATATSPWLVERLVDLLAAAGYFQVTVGSASDPSYPFLENRDVLVLADLLGYKWQTPLGNAYEIVDLGENLADVPFGEACALHGTRIGRAWVEADFRIDFAKNKTHPEFFYAGCLHNLLTILPERDKHFHYCARLKPWDVALELLEHVGPHFSLIDALTSSDGNWGATQPHPVATRTLIAGSNALAVDWVMATKMLVDPWRSRLNAKAMASRGVPTSTSVNGDLSPYPGWRNTHPLLSNSLSALGEWPELGAIVFASSVSADSELFPFKETALGQLNRVLANPPGQPNGAGSWMRLPALGLMSAGVRWVDAGRTLFAKRKLRQRSVPLGLDLDKYTQDDYAAIVDYMAPLERLLEQTPEDHNGLRWRYLRDSVVFRYARVVDVPFEEFVERVDVSRAIQFMTDYIGGVSVAVARDQRGRVVRQAERNLYLPQPNYLVLYGGDVIDVCKLERIVYDEDSHKMVWRTVQSPNHSAEYDDGSVAFERDHERTRVTVTARQKFALPPIVESWQLHLNPAVKDALVADAYYRFFEQTITNFEIEFEGGSSRIGHPWRQPGESEDLLRASVDKAKDFAARLDRAARAGRGATPDVTTDALGFRHFKGPGLEMTSSTSAQSGAAAKPASQSQRLRSVGAGLQTFWSELWSAARRDWGLFDEGERR